MRTQKHRQRGESGAAYLEFALVLPVLMVLLLGGIEISRYVQSSQKIDKLTHTLVDLVGQAPTVSMADMAQIMQATEHITAGMDFAQSGKVIISCVGYDANGQLVVKWQYQGSGALARTSKIGNSGGAATMPDGFTVESKDNVIVAESYFLLSPLANAQIVSATEFYRTAFYLPRLGDLSTLAP